MDSVVAAAVAQSAATARGLRLSDEPLQSKSYRHTVIMAVGGGLRVVIKVGPPEHAPQMEHEVRMAQAFRAQGVRVAMPLGELELMSLSPGSEAYPVSLWHWEPGTHEPADAASLTHLGQSLRLMHDSSFHVPPSTLRPDVAGTVKFRWDRLEADIQASPSHPWHGCRPILEWMGSRVEQITAEHEALIDPPGPGFWCHSDLSMLNLLFAHRRTVILDLELAARYSVRRDLASLVMAALEGTLTMSQLQHVLAGYGSIAHRADLYPMGPMRQLTRALWHAEIVGNGRVTPAMLAQDVEIMRRNPEGRPEWLRLVRRLFPE